MMYKRAIAILPMQTAPVNHGIVECPEAVQTKFQPAKKALPASIQRLDIVMGVCLSGSLVSLRGKIKPLDGLVNNQIRFVNLTASAAS